VTILSALLAIAADWRHAFPQQRTHQRAVRQALGWLVCLGRRCLTRMIWTNGGQHRSWSAEYFLHSRCRWEPQRLFQPILKRALEFCPQRLIGVAWTIPRCARPAARSRRPAHQRRARFGEAVAPNLLRPLAD